MKKIILSLAIISAFVSATYAQNDIQLTQYVFAEPTFNPSLCGSTNTIDGALGVRQQWMGFDGGPSTQYFQANAFFEPAQGGLGISFINDKVGYLKTMDFKLMYAYKLQLDKNSMISMGLGAGFLSSRIEGSSLIYDETDDPSAITTDEGKFSPDFSVGFAYHNPNMVAGISSTHINQSFKKATIFKYPRHYYIYSKFKIDASDIIKIVPSILIRTNFYITQFDLGGQVYFNNRFWGGASYRLNDALCGMAGVYITPYLKLGYSYDYNCGAVKKNSAGSHEIVLSGSFKGFKASKEFFPSF
ncbi:MAG: type IX secretion system membrane protein PorP/SprF [Bacteroidota bacterium]